MSDKRLDPESIRQRIAKDDRDEEADTSWNICRAIAEAPEPVKACVVGTKHDQHQCVSAWDWWRAARALVGEGTT